VQQEATHGALAAEPVKAAGTADRIHCTYCRSQRVFRVYRQGFFQEKIYPMFGFYPWKCKACSAYMLLHRRKRSTTKPTAYVQ